LKLNKSKRASVMALKMAQDYHPQGALPVEAVTEGTKLTKGQLKKLVRKGVLKKAYIEGKDGNRHLHFYVAPQVRRPGPLNAEA